MAEDTTSSVIDEPDPPDSAPKYIVEGLGKQDADTLHELAEYAKRLAEWRTAQAAAELARRVG